MSDPLRYYKYSTVLYMVTVNSIVNCPPRLIWKLPKTITDELVIPTRIAFEDLDGIELRRGELQFASQPDFFFVGVADSAHRVGSLQSNIKHAKFTITDKTVQAEQ